MPARPLLLLQRPEAADVVALVPDGPPRQFRWRGVLHQVAEAQGPERIAPEWWRRTADADARLLRRRGRGGPPLLALPRRPLRPRRRPPRNGSCTGCSDDALQLSSRNFASAKYPGPRIGLARALCPQTPGSRLSAQWGPRSGRDDTMTAFAELVAATNFSFLRGASHAHEMVGQAAELGLAAIGIADRNTLAGVVRAHRAAKEHKIRCLRCAPRPARRPWQHHRRLRGRLLSHRPRGLRPAVPPADGRQPARHQRPVPFHASRRCSPRARARSSSSSRRGSSRRFSASACARSPPPRRGRTYLAAAFAYRRQRAPPARRAGRARRRDARPARRHQRRRSITIPTASRSPTCSPASARNARFSHAGYRLEANAERHLKPGAEMARLFAQYPQAVARSLEIAERIHFNLDELRYEYPDEPVPPGKTPQAYLRGADLGARRPALSRRRAGQGARAARQGAGADRQARLRALFPHRLRHRALRPRARPSCARAAARPPTARCASASASPPSIPPRSTCCSSASSPPTAASRPTSTSISSTSGARR